MSKDDYIWLAIKAIESGDYKKAMSHLRAALNTPA